ncbi:hypothetical protein M2271_002902 [Streptomyces sp. LBL]|nr:hypothetical protein [Streptomyces sp. LBL]
MAPAEQPLTLRRLVRSACTCVHAERTTLAVRVAGCPADTDSGRSDHLHAVQLGEVLALGQADRGSATSPRIRPSTAKGLRAGDFTSPDAREGLSAFAERRQPDFPFAP